MNTDEHGCGKRMGQAGAILGSTFVKAGVRLYFDLFIRVYLCSSVVKLNRSAQEWEVTGHLPDAADREMSFLTGAYSESRWGRCSEAEETSNNAVKTTDEHR